ncbi:LOW QUALITY PROTEIN: inactive tyrosine-protein kinase transmembrane receptor ROR1-like [Pollicipes pollicipes]|uniref:LOW QUALITY PROTEIN: inactive tyrosine-protein kinase transmembrane receptor ROR1-like n=1 Tax=Pollicipes pollicipes TaxID=41117 RepID=UPI0018849867|nr:LOW QUALITY PROTEIN: inactive tyrosine-protein kinase transmembrane receptor ROR1-like [Pollicipes pollicipes]
MAGPALFCAWLLVSLSACSIVTASKFSRPRRLAGQEAPPSPPPAVPGTCLQYRGRLCAGRLYDHSVFVALPDTLARVEERLRAALSVIQGSPDLSEACAEFTLPAVCLAAFPPCDAGGGAPRPRQICRDECEHLRDALCKREYAIARAHPLIGQKIALPVCEQLPPVGSAAAVGCLRLPLPRPERCGLPRCARPLLWYIWRVAVPGVTLLVLCALICICCCLCRRIRRKTVPPGVSTKLVPTAPLEEKPANAENKQQALELPLNEIHFKEELGEGAFGKVFRGELAGRGPDGSPLPVAVKTLKSGAAPRTQLDFRREWQLMAELRHPNIVRLLGVVLEAAPQCLVFEHMSGGDLHEFLVARSPRGSAPGRPPGGATESLSQAQLFDIAAQVADGMAYLTCHHYVHRDLAARNCLVGEGLTVKISDFGLSRDIYSSDYYRLQTKSLLPVRWMPAESILYGKFTNESDVWSFGVLLWEIFSFGLQPYYGYSSAEVVEMVRRRQLLPAPEDAPAALYDLMLDCWHQTPCRRPRFAELLARLRSWQCESGGSTDPAKRHQPAGSVERLRPAGPGERLQPGPSLARSEVVLNRMSSTGSLPGRGTSRV